MNRRKKINKILTKKGKLANRRNIASSKPPYVSKAEREALEKNEEENTTS